MRLMYSCPSTFRYRQTPLRKWGIRTYLTPVDMPRREPRAYTSSESINARPSSYNLANFKCKDLIAMLFLQNSLLFSCKRLQKYTFFSI